MKNLIGLFIIILVFGSLSILSAQNVPGVANGAIANNSRDDYDNGTRIRSIEMERLKKESYRTNAAAKSAENRRINYSQIKKDFESLQNLQSEIVRIYVTGKQINYRRISELASKLNLSAKRLSENLLISAEKPSEKFYKTWQSEDVKSLIIIIDKSIGKFVVNPIFKNLNVLETKDAEKAHFDLQNVIQLSDFLAQKAEKQK